MRGLAQSGLPWDAHPSTANFWIWYFAWVGWHPYIYIYPSYLFLMLQDFDILGPFQGLVSFWSPIVPETRHGRCYRWRGHGLGGRTRTAGVGRYSVALPALQTPCNWPAAIGGLKQMTCRSDVVAGGLLYYYPTCQRGDIRMAGGKKLLPIRSVEQLSQSW